MPMLRTALLAPRPADNAGPVSYGVACAGSSEHIANSRGNGGGAADFICIFVFVLVLAAGCENDRKCGSHFRMQARRQGSVQSLQVRCVAHVGHVRRCQPPRT